METAFEGAWDIAVHHEEIGDRRLRVTVLGASEEALIRERRDRLERGIAAVQELGRGKGSSPNRVMDNDFLYPDDEERA